MGKKVFEQNAKGIPIKLLDIIIIIGIAAMAILIPVMAAKGEADKTEEETIAVINNE